MPENLVALFPQLFCSCGSLFFAIVIAIFGVLLFRSAGQRQRLQTVLAKLPLQSIATLKPGQGLVRLKGIISQVPEPVPPSLDVAVLRVVLREKEVGEEERMMDRVQARPFLLDDGTGTILVDPTGLDRSLLGEGTVPEPEDRAAVLQAVGLPPSLGGLVQVWALQTGQEVTVVGTVQNRGDQMVIAKAQGQPLIISPGDISDLLAQTAKQSTSACVWGIALALIILGLLTVSGILLLRVFLTLSHL